MKKKVAASQVWLCVFVKSLREHKAVWQNNKSASHLINRQRTISDEWTKWELVDSCSVMDPVECSPTYSTLLLFFSFVNLVEQTIDWFSFSFCLAIILMHVPRRSEFVLNFPPIWFCSNPPIVFFIFSILISVRVIIVLLVNK